MLQVLLSNEVNAEIDFSQTGGVERRQAVFVKG